MVRDPSDGSVRVVELEQQVADWMAYADKLEAALELAAGQSKDQLMKLHAEQGLRIVRPDFNPEQGT